MRDRALMATADEGRATMKLLLTSAGIKNTSIHDVLTGESPEGGHDQRPE
jgi:hypothetical protein